VSEEITQGYRLSPQQKHLLLLQRHTSAVASVFWSRCAVRVTGPLDPERLERAVKWVVEQHEILRTTFALLPGMTLPAQVIHEESPACVKQSDLTSLSKEEQNALVLKLFDETADTDSGYGSLPLFSCDLLRLSADETVLLLKAPVVCADLRSLEIIVRQIASHYESESRTLEVMQYADFAEWHYALLEGEDGEAGRRYWSSQVLRPDVKIGFASSMVKETFAPEALRLEVSSESAAELARVALACWQILIQRLNTPSSVTIGKAIDGRRHPELENSVGLYNRYVPLPINVEERLSTNRFLEILATAEEEAIQWQEYFDWETGDGPAKYFPVCFEERRGQMIFRAGDVTFSIYRGEATDDYFELKLVSVLNEEVPRLELHYDASRYAREDMRRLGEELTTLIADFINKPGAAINDLQSLSSEARLRIVKGFNQTSQNFPANCIHKMFEAQVEKTPNLPAVLCGSAQISYAELNRRANQLARYLQKLNVGPDVPVGLCLERSIDFAVGMLGILKAGGAYVPLDVNTPLARLQTMLSEAGVTVLLTHEQKVISGVRVLLMNDLRDELAKEDADNCSNKATPPNLAYVIFTSGSTGKPKGVAVEHRQLCNYVHAIDSRIGLSSCGSFAIVSTLVADLAHTSLFPSLLSGGALHLIPEDQAASPKLLADYFSRNPVDCLKIVPAHLSALLTSPGAVDILPRRHLLLGGEATPRRLLDHVWQLSAGVTIWNHYGPTETTVGCVAQQIDRETQAPAIGTPLSNNTVYILDQRLRPVSIGVVGELYVGGAQVARGYVNRPDLTAESFVPDPFSESPGGRLYRTGDSARYLTDGRIELLGRVDHQLKLRGYRIEPEEIQFALNRHAQISQSVVVAREDRRGEKQLVAYVVAKDSASPAADDLRSFLGKHLPDYMVPWKFVFLEALPLTPNGKIDRQALPVPDAVEKQYVAPRNSIEQELSRIWASVLAIAEPGINENFFELGGDSILGIQVVARANQAGMNLVTRQIFQHQTIAELAAVAQDGARPRADQGIVTGEVPLTPVQARFFELTLQEPHHYNQAKFLELKQPTDSAYLKGAVATLLHHHDALRLRFECVGESWNQINSAPESDVPFERIDISHCDEPGLAKLLQSEADRLHASLNLQAGPIVRVALFDGADKRVSYLLIVVHHLAVDAVSWGVLLEDLETAYRQLTAGEQVSLPPKTTSFKRWAEELTQFARSSTIEKEITYWTSRLPQAVTRLPVDQSGSNTVASRRTVSVSLTADETRAILHEPTKHRTQINEVLLSAMTRTFTGWMKTSSFLIDLEGHGREHLVEGIDLTRTVGWFTTIFPVMFDIGNASTPLEVLRAVKEQLRAVPNRGIGYGLLRYLSSRTNVIDELAGSPQAEVRFNYLGQLDRFLASSNLFDAAQHASGQAQSPRGERGYLLNIISSVTDEELRFDWTYSENIHTKKTIESLAETCLAELRALLSDSETTDAVYAPADFPKAKLSQSDLNTILAKLRR
jgi:amino acid adenylation domain-containing protein/non-ribosomal peptide synthase protein (TIGR01720 family)